jgi:hypothetical protein
MADWNVSAIFKILETMYKALNVAAKWFAILFCI